MPRGIVTDGYEKQLICRNTTYTSDQPGEEHWYVVYTRTRHEKYVAKQCTERGITAFVPLYRVQRRWKQRVTEVLLPLFPSYVFVHISLRERVRVLGLPGIVSLVSFRGTPAVVPESQIETLSNAINLGRAEPHIYLHTGKRVRVAAGPLAGLEGVVVEIRKRTQVIVSFEWMARSVAISLDPSEVESLL
jgi:transcription antitermination factor NusG